MHLNKFLFYSTLFLVIISTSCETEKSRQPAYEKPAIDPDPPVRFLSPEESIESFYLPEGYRIELVASEPMINEPVSMAFDADGKLYVAQMETYMQDIGASNQNMPWSKILLLEDLDGDGKMDKRTVFIDSLVLPRVVVPLDGRLIVRETFKQDFWSYRDTDGDGVADEKKLILADSIISKRNMEHQPGSMLWNLDNYLYLSREGLRYKFQDNQLVSEPMRSPPFGQWGLGQDETGRMYYSLAGGENPAVGFQLHPIYGSLELPRKWEKGFEEPWPVIGTPDVQGGKRRLREDNTLNHFTAPCGQAVFLGDNLPDYGNLFIAEPVGRLIRKAEVSNIDGRISLRNAYEKTEFIASTDANFRPVEINNGPDGCLYIVDMYRGIIQESQWVNEGGYLHTIVKKTGLDKNIGKGRIYRVVHEDYQPSKPEKLLSKSAEELLPYLGHQNGWYRINAQKLLVLKGDQSVIPNLKELAKTTKPWFGAKDMDYGIMRLHALWTLQGLGALDKDFLIEMLEDEDQRVRSAAIRNCEPWLKSGDQLVFDKLKEMVNDADKNVQIQLGLSMRSSNTTEARAVIYELMKNDRHNMVLAYTGEEGLKEKSNEEIALLERHPSLNPGGKQSITNGLHIYNGLCADCHGKNGKGVGDIAPPLVGSARVTGNIQVLTKILLDGLSGPVDGKEYAGVMIPMKAQDDQWIADVLSYLRIELNNSTGVNTRQVSIVRNQTKDRVNGWTLEELQKQ